MSNFEPSSDFRKALAGWVHLSVSDSIKQSPNKEWEEVHSNVLPSKPPEPIKVASGVEQVYLTEEQLDEIWNKVVKSTSITETRTYVRFAREVERQLKEKFRSVIF